jgi:glycosyltransferase involved in cell wall biosynthesis
MKVLWLSDSPMTPSGFGNVTGSVCEGLVRCGHEVHILGWQTHGASQPWNGATLHGIGWHPMGANVLLSYLCRLRPDVLISLADVWWLTFLTDPAIEQFFEMTPTRWMMYFPIDGHRLDHTLPPSWIEILQRADVPIAMSEYGQQMTRSCGVACEYIPHGVDTSIFRPAAQKHAAKRHFGYEDHFVILSDARNQPRKMLPRLLTIFERFARDKPDVILHLHCDPQDPATMEDRYSYRIDADVRALGLGDQVRFTPGFTIKGGLPLDELARIYQAADVHMLVSHGEGFGLPTLQAAACGVIPMAPAYSANCELIAGHGATMSISEFVPDEFGIGRAFVDIEDAVTRLHELHGSPRLLADWSGRSHDFAQSYDWSRIIPMWDALLRRPVSSRTFRARITAPEHTDTISIKQEASAPHYGPLASYRRDEPRTPPSLDSAIGRSLDTEMRAHFASLPGGVNITLKVSEQRAGEVALQVLEDARADPGSPRLSIPIARTERDDAHHDARKRTTGLVYVMHTGTMSQGVSIALFRALRELFPILRDGSRDTQELVDGHEFSTFTQRAPYPIHIADQEVSWFRDLAASILAINLDPGADELPAWTAYLGVPTIGLSQNCWQRLFWPDLSIETLHDSTLLRRARCVLTDHVATASMTADALRAFDHYAPPSIKRKARHLEAVLMRSSGDVIQPAVLAQ